MNTGNEIKFILSIHTKLNVFDISSVFPICFLFDKPQNLDSKIEKKKMLAK